MNVDVPVTLPIWNCKFEGALIVLVTPMRCVNRRGRYDLPVNQVPRVTTGELNFTVFQEMSTLVEFVGIGTNWPWNEVRACFPVALIKVVFNFFVVCFVFRTFRVFSKSSAVVKEICDLDVAFVSNKYFFNDVTFRVSHGIITSSRAATSAGNLNIAESVNTEIYSCLLTNGRAMKCPVLYRVITMILNYSII